MAEILIHRCTLRLVRRGGWSWGPDPKRLLEEVVRILPVLLAQGLADLMASHQDSDFAAPLRVLLRLRMSELMTEPAVAHISNTPSTPTVSAVLEQRVELALRAALGLPEPPPKAEPPAQTTSKPPSRIAARTLLALPHRGGPLEHSLSAWHVEGSLSRRLALLPASEIELWHAALMADSRQRATTSPAPPSDLLDQVEVMARRLIAEQRSSDRTSSLVSRLSIAARIAAELGIAVAHPVVWRVLDQLVPAREIPISEARDTLEAGASKPPQRFESKPETEITETALLSGTASIAAAGAADSSQWDVRIGCALPFLLLAPLIQTGYLSTLAAVLEAAGLEQEAPLFAAALAYKVLEAPERGWNRSPASRLAASVFAGFQEPLDEELLVDFSRKIGPHTSALDLTLSEALTAGHTVNSPVLLYRADLFGSKSWLLIDFPGCFPIACFDQPKQILPLLERLGRPIVLIADDAAEPALLADLDAAGVNFISKLPPGRKERWRRIQQGPSTLGWTNSQTGDLDLLQRAARDVEVGTSEAEALWQTFAISRPGIIHTCSSEFERSLTLAASVALGMVSWQLWQTRGRTTPQQALEAYHNFDAHVHFRPNAVEVRLPLGRRRSSLYEAGLLASIGDIPWFGDRRVEYEGG